MTWEELSARSDDQLARIDPALQNLEVAKGIPSLAHLHVAKYRHRLDRWAQDFRSRLPDWEVEFHKTPWDWDNDIDLFRLGQLCFYTDQVLGIRYKEEQKYVAKISYTDPSDLFLNGVMDSRQGTCGNLAALHQALGWRLGWPVSLALARWHCFLRFEKGSVVWNIESSNTAGGFRVNPDRFYLEQHRLTPEQIRSGSDLTFLKPRQLLGWFIGLRGRHWWDMIEADKASADYRLASRLFPESRLFREKADQADFATKAFFNRTGGESVAPRGYGNSITFGMGYQE